MLVPPSKIYVKESPIHGWGVFSNTFIPKDEIIEECPLLFLPIEKGESTPLLIDYRFNFPSEGEWTSQVIPLGYGCVYNHSETPNVRWYSNTHTNTLVFITLRSIQMGEELLSYYGGNSYWADGRSKINLV